MLSMWTVRARLAARKKIKPDVPCHLGEMKAVKFTFKGLRRPGSLPFTSRASKI